MPKKSGKEHIISWASSFVFAEREKTSSDSPSAHKSAPPERSAAPAGEKTPTKVNEHSKKEKKSAIPPALGTGRACMRRASFGMSTAPIETAAFTVGTQETAHKAKAEMSSHKYFKDCIKNKIGHIFSAEEMPELLFVK